MTKNWLMIMLILGTMWVFFGCAGLAGRTTPSTPEPLWETIQESFHSTLTDPEAKRFMTELDLTSLPHDLRLEVIILRKLAGASDEKDLDKAFDRLWEEEDKIRELVHLPDKREGFIHPLVEIYYLLSAGPAQSWKEETAERIYRETLCRLKPSQLSGYALHFYTLALLKNGKFDIVFPFLCRLEHYTPPPLHIRDLAVALAYAGHGGSYEIVCRLMTAICKHDMKSNSDFPDKELRAAIIALKEDGKLNSAQKALLPIVRENPRLRRHSFVQLLEDLEVTPVGEWEVNKLSAGVKKHTVLIPEITGEKNKSDHSNFIEKRKSLRVEVQIIKAGEGSTHIDPAIAEISERLQEILHFSSFSLIDNKTLYLRMREKGGVSLPQGRFLKLMPSSVAPDISRIDVTILKSRREVFHTTIESVDGGVTIIGGPDTGDGVILLRITTYIVKKDFTSRNHAMTIGIRKNPFDFTPVYGNRV